MRCRIRNTMRYIRLARRVFSCCSICSAMHQLLNAPLSLPSSLRAIIRRIISCLLASLSRHSRHASQHADAQRNRQRARTLVLFADMILDSRTFSFQHCSAAARTLLHIRSTTLRNSSCRRSCSAYCARCAAMCWCHSWNTASCVCLASVSTRICASEDSSRRCLILLRMASSSCSRQLLELSSCLTRAARNASTLLRHKLKHTDRVPRLHLRTRSVALVMSRHVSSLSSFCMEPPCTTTEQMLCLTRLLHHVRIALYSRRRESLRCMPRSEMMFDTFMCHTRRHDNTVLFMNIPRARLILLRSLRNVMIVHDHVFIT